MKQPYLFTFLLFVFFTSCENKTAFNFQSDSFCMTLNEKGHITQFIDLKNEKNYLPNGLSSPFLSLQKNGTMMSPTSAKYVPEMEQLELNFADGTKAGIKVKLKGTHITFELTSVSEKSEIDVVVWGPYPTSIDSLIGETVGVVRNGEFAMGIQSLNAKTLGGYPWNDNDHLPQFDIFEMEDPEDMNPEKKNFALYSIEGAKPTKYGSSLQAYCRDRSKARLIANWGKEKYMAPALPFDDGGVIGSKIALFGCPVEKALSTIGNIEEAELLPHPMLDGEWAKISRAASAAYMILDFDEQNIEKCIDYTKQAGLKYLYHSDPFKNWGHFELKESFPNGWDGMKNCSEKAKAKGLKLGLHTLSNFITTNDPYVTPVPDETLAKVGSSITTQAIDKKQTEIPIEDPSIFKQMEKNHLKTVQIMDELIRYGQVSEEAPWKLLDCQRGAFGTTVSEYGDGAHVSLLTDHAYKVFLGDASLSMEMAQRLAEKFNYAGLHQISFDGLEGMHATGMGNYGELLFALAWYTSLSSDIQSNYIADASRSGHYFWHIYTRMNWGEPWYAGFRESQTEYRLRNQKYFQRNFMPGMLGWFSMRSGTSIEDIEWMLTRSAAYNAGFAFVTNFEVLEKNGQTADILAAIGEWEKARMADVFSKEQKKRMEGTETEFHLEPQGENGWDLFQIHSFKFTHEKKVRQPGEPLHSVFEFENPVDEQPLHFILTAVESTVADISLEVDNYKKINLPVTLKAGQCLKFSGGTEALILDANWNRVGTIPLDENSLKIGTGRHVIHFDCAYTNAENKAKAKFEIRLTGPAESVKLN